MFLRRYIIGCFLFGISFSLVTTSNGQNNKIKCYFNHPVNTTISTGIKAVNLGSKFPDTIAAYINRAKYTLDICIYNFDSSSSVSKLWAAVNNAYSRGVAIRWVFDASSNNYGLNKINPLIDTLGSPDKANYIMHNKFIIIDVNSPDTNDALVISGSYNWTSQQTNTDYNNIVIIQDKQLALGYYSQFNQMWGTTAQTPNRSASKFGTGKTTSTVTSYNVNGTPIELYFSPKDGTMTKLKNAIKTADDDLFFGIYAFTDTPAANTIKNRALAGVRTRGIMDNFSKTYDTYATILGPFLGPDLMLYAGTGLYHSKVMLIDALTPSSDPQVATGSFNWSLSANIANDENLLIIHEPFIANQYYQAMCQDFKNMGGASCTFDPCYGSTSTLVSNLLGTAYQWQVNPGTGFVNITDNTNYAGTATQNLTITGATSGWYGYQYRCIVDGTNSDTTVFKYTSYWNGSVNTAWDNSANWNCGLMPDSNSDVLIYNTAPNYPVINIDVYCRSLFLQPGAKCSVSPAVKLYITKP